MFSLQIELIIGAARGSSLEWSFFGKLSLVLSMPLFSSEIWFRLQGSLIHTSSSRDGHEEAFYSQLFAFIKSESGEGRKTMGWTAGRKNEDRKDYTTSNLTLIFIFRKVWTINRSSFAVSYCARTSWVIVFAFPISSSDLREGLGKTLIALRRLSRHWKWIWWT